jgi:hypothetical protein
MGEFGRLSLSPLAKFRLRSPPIGIQLIRELTAAPRELLLDVVCEYPCLYMSSLPTVETLHELVSYLPEVLEAIVFISDGITILVREYFWPFVGHKESCE